MYCPFYEFRRARIITLVGIIVVLTYTIRTRKIKMEVDRDQEGVEVEVDRDAHHVEEDVAEMISLDQSLTRRDGRNRRQLKREVEILHR